MNFECSKCDNKFALSWRLKKHEGLHNSQNTRKFHYFNNKKKCPFEEFGCMFLHEESRICNYGESCTTNLCSAEVSGEKSSENEQLLVGQAE